MSLRDGKRGRASVLLAALVMAASLLTGFGVAHGAALELAVKAAYLYKVAPFVDWPPQAFSSATAPFLICIQGEDPFRELLDRAVSGQRMGGRPIRLERLSRVDAASGCQIAYIGGSAAQPRAAALQALRGAHVLTVTDQSNGADPRGMIHFVLSGGRVRFEVDLHQAEAAGVTISSKLLALAVSVVR
jgi:hypothetical protein